MLHPVYERSRVRLGVVLVCTMCAIVLLIVAVLLT